MKKILFALIAILGFGSSTSLKAQPFFDTSDAETFLSFGARLGFNTSNRSFPSANYSNRILNTSWGLGFNVGAVANLNFKEYLTLQPGFFFETRNSSLVNYAELPNPISGKIDEVYVAKDTQKSCKFTIPIMGIVKFNISDRVKWDVELGPYFQFNLKENGSQSDVRLFAWGNGGYVEYFAHPRSFDVGLKMGTGLNIYDHYYVGVHYMAGLCNAWKIPEGGKNKSWMFTIGYDF